MDAWLIKLALSIALERKNLRPLRLTKIIMLVFAVFLVLNLNSEIYGQSANEIGSSSRKAQSETSTNTFAPIGRTGYQVLIPEIKMRQIGGNSKPKPTAEVPQEPMLPESITYESVTKETLKEPSAPSELAKAEQPGESSTQVPLDRRSDKPTIPFDREDLVKGFLIAVILALSLGKQFAEGNSYVVIKDKNGVCRIVKGVKKTPSTIAGPFRTKELAKRAKEKESPKPAAQAILPVRDYVQLRLPVRHYRIHVTNGTSATGRLAGDNAQVLTMPASNKKAVKKTKMKIAPKVAVGA
jgi:hypothetical protein